MNTKSNILICVCAAWAICATPNAKGDFTFGDPVNLGPIVNSAYNDGVDFVSPDGLEVYFDSDRPGGWGDWDMWVAVRATKDDE